jgi:hypothetical protein
VEVDVPDGLAERADVDALRAERAFQRAAQAPKQRAESDRLGGAQLGDGLDVPVRLDDQPAAGERRLDRVIDVPGAVVEDRAARRLDPAGKNVAGKTALDGYSFESPRISRAAAWPRSCTAARFWSSGASAWSTGVSPDSNSARSSATDFDSSSLRRSSSARGSAAG